MHSAIAERIAREAHAGQTEESTGDNYIRHVERVVALVEGCDEKAVAWLHDVIEDSRFYASNLFAAGIPWRIIDAVVWLTRPEFGSYAEYIQMIKDSGDPLAIAVKIADLRDHLRPPGLFCLVPSLRKRYEAAWLRLTGEPWKPS